jgi:hypothetical protein
MMRLVRQELRLLNAEDYQAGGVAGQHEVEAGEVDVRLVPVDQRDLIRGHPNVAGVAVHDARLTPVRCALAAQHRATLSRSTFVPVSAYSTSLDDRQPGCCGQPRVNRCRSRSAPATRRQSTGVSGGPLSG